MMIDEHIFWEKLLYEYGMCEDAIYLFVERCEYASTPNYKPKATSIIRDILTNRAQFMIDNLINNNFMYSNMFERAIDNAISNLPSDLVEEVAEYAKEEIPSENMDVCEWNV